LLLFPKGLKFHSVDITSVSKLIDAQFSHFFLESDERFRQQGYIAGHVLHELAVLGG